MSKELLAISNERINQLDYLRGLLAFAIMIYHYLSFGNDIGLINFKYDAQMFIARIGVYGVSIFYILSGLTLHLVYEKWNFYNKKVIGAFFVRRFFRIFPLFVFLTTLSFILSRNYSYENFIKFFTNITGLFSIFAWDKYFITGGWSIGNEIFFYLLFPLFMLILKFNKPYLYLIYIASFLLYCFFCYMVLPTVDSNYSWSYYVNPLNQLFLFISGIFIGFLKDTRLSLLYQYTFLIIILLSFILYPSSSDWISIVSGNNRIVLTLLSLGLVVIFYKLQFSKSNIIGKLLEFLGKISYSVYLLHPFVYHFILKFFKSDFLLVFILSVFITVITSYLSYQYYESYFIRFAKRIIKI